MNIGKRKHKRLVVEELDIHAKTLLTAGVDILDISSSGACIKVPKNLNIGSNYLIKFENENILLPLKFTVKWVKFSGRLEKSDGDLIPVYTTGIEFMDISPDMNEALWNFIGRFALTDEQRFGYEKKLSKLRFKIHTDETALLDYEESYIVKKISTGGMLVETNYKIQIERRLPMELFLANDSLPLKFQGRIASCTEIPDKKSKCFDIGIEFIDMDDNDMSKLSRFILVLLDK
jgi:c-di-GMP-binding flagellar brake protein YcgR